MELLHSGKVREVYADGDDILLVASDRVSIYDVVLPTPIPDKGKILTQLSLWWFARLADIVPNHVISASDVPAEWAGRAVRCRRLEMIPVECIARGYLAGLGLQEYRATGSVSGVPLPPGLEEGSRLPERLRDLTLAVYSRGAATAAANGVIIADTKLEFGWAVDGTLTLAYEVLTP